MTRAREQALYSLGKVYSVAGDSKSLLSILDSAEVRENFSRRFSPKYFLHTNRSQSISNITLPAGACILCIRTQGADS